MTIKKKPCKTCKKVQDIEELPSVEEVVTPIVITTPDDILKVWGHLNEFKSVNTDEIKDYVRRIYKDVTGKELDIAGCFGCKRTKILSPFKWYVQHKFGIELK